jgi:hypothetical protein
MKSKLILVGTLALVVALPAFAQQTPPSMVASYESIADIILASRELEANFVRSLLDGHFHAAKAHMKAGDYAAAAAEMALFANEGDNAVGGVRKRLLEGGHHYNAEGEEKGVYEPGYVIVTREAKVAALAASAALRQATTDDARQKAWDDFAQVAEGLLGKKPGMM